MPVEPTDSERHDTSEEAGLPRLKKPREVKSISEEFHPGPHDHEIREHEVEDEDGGDMHPREEPYPAGPPAL